MMADVEKSPISALEPDRGARIPHSLLSSDRSGAARAQLEGFIHEQYAAAFDAQLSVFQPNLLGLADRSGVLLGAGGIRPGWCGEPFYLDAYMDQPAERELSAQLGHFVPRAAIAEVGSLVTTAPGGGRWLIVTLAAWLEGAGLEWIVFTATGPLQRLLNRAGARLIDLALADPGRLSDHITDWGRYYDTNPRVMAMNLAENREQAAGWALGFEWLVARAFMEGTRHAARKAA